VKHDHGVALALAKDLLGQDVNTPSSALTQPDFGIAFRDA
jgi:hypothetical protein